MRHRSQSSPSVNLFAFLDILICTMGALILMLMVVTTRQLRKDSLAQVLAELKNPPPPRMSVEPPRLAAPPSVTSIMIPAQPEAEPEPLALESSEPAINPRDRVLAERAAALAQREQELHELLAEWHQKTGALTQARDQHAKSLEQRRRLKEVAARQGATLQDEAQGLEAKLGGLTRELLNSTGGDSTSQERQAIEQQIAAVQRRLKAAQATAAGGESKFMVVPFDAQSGTSRRPILIECTADGLRFLPEDIVIRPDDLEGFTARVNPLLAGSNALVSYWTAWNLKQPQPARQPEPYVLMLVRPSGTVAYYIAIKMLATLQQPHGYELIEEDTQLQQPPVDLAAKAACEAAIKRLLAERAQIKEFASKRSGVGGFLRGGGSGNDAFRSGSRGTGGSESQGGSGATGSAGGPGEATVRSASTNRFELTDVTGDDHDVGSRSWERIENFAGRNPRSTGQGGPQSVAKGMNGLAPGQRITEGDEHESAANGSDSGVRRSVSGDGNVGRRGASEPNRQASGKEASGNSPPPGDSGIERLAEESDADSATGAAVGADRGEAPLDIGLGSTGPMAVPVIDRRSKKSALNKPIEPEMLSHKRWGLSAADAAIGLEREVRIDVESKRLVVGGKHAISMGNAESRQETLERLVTVLDLQARDWGQPPQGFFWKPSLRFVVAKDGNPNYEQARALTERSGLSTSKEYAPDTADKTGTAATTGSATTPPASKPLRVTRGGTP